MTTEPDSPSCSRDAEMGILCSMTLAKDVALECSRLPESYFHIPAYLLIFRALKELIAADRPVDFITLKHRLKSAGELEEVGGPEFLNELLTFVPSASNYRTYVDDAKDYNDRRVTILVSRQLEEKARDLLTPLSQSFADTVVPTLTALAGMNYKEPRSFTEQLGDTLDEIERRSHGEAVSPVRFGIPALDQALCGLRPGELAVIGARTGKGKSALGGQAVITTALAGKACAIFSLEMDATQIAERMLSNVGQISMKSLRTGRLEKDEYPRLTEAHKKLNSLPIHIADEFCVDISMIVSRVRQLHARNPLSLVIVDYIQLVESAAVGKQANRETHVSEVARKLKLLATELRIVVIAMSQLNDDGQLRESRAIGQNADLTIYIEEEDKIPRKIVTKKGRNVGADQEFLITFDGPHMTFSERKTLAEVVAEETAKPVKSFTPIPNRWQPHND